MMKTKNQTRKFKAVNKIGAGDANLLGHVQVEVNRDGVTIQLKPRPACDVRNALRVLSEALEQNIAPVAQMVHDATENAGTQSYQGLMHLVEEK